MIKPSIFLGNIEHGAQYNEDRIRLIKQELKGLPKGKLVINARTNGFTYYEYINGNRRGIKKDMDRVHDLGRAEYLRTCLKVLEKEQAWAAKGLKQLNQANGGFHAEDNAIYKCLVRLKNAGLDVARIVCSTKQILWRNQQSDNHSRREELRWPSLRGIMMRSMQETNLDNIFDEYGLPVRYEMAFKVDVTGMQGVKGAFNEGGRLYKIYYPDFTILLPDGSYVIWEHLGRIDLEIYRNHLGEKMAAYLSSGAISQDRLILTFPADVSNPAIIHKIIQEKILPLL